MESVLFFISLFHLEKTRSEWRLPGMLRSRHGSLYLFVGDKHHNVPGSQAKERGHEPRWS